MLYNRSLLVFCFLIFLFSCKKDEIEFIKDANGVIRSKAPIWKVKLTDGGYISTMFNPVVCNDNVIMGSFKGNKPGMTAINIVSGKKIWENYPYRFSSFIPDFYHIYDNKMITSEGRIEIFNLDDGTKIWENLNGNSNMGRVYGIDNLIFTNEIENNALNPFKIRSGWVYNIDTKLGERFYMPDLGEIPINSNLSYIGGVEFIIPYKNENNDIMLYVFTSSSVKYVSGEDFGGLYNYTKKEWVYKDLPMEGSPLNSGLQRFCFSVYNNKIYFVSVKGIECYDLNSGKQVWKYVVEQGIGGFVICNNKVIGIEGDMDKKIFALDVENGFKIWSTPSSAGQLTSTMQFLNGIVYFVSTTDGRLHAVNAETGKYVWLIDSPDLKADDGAWFIRNCTVLPGENGKKGKVFVSSYLYGYCYEAEQ